MTTDSCHWSSTVTRKFHNVKKIMTASVTQYIWHCNFQYKDFWYSWVIFWFSLKLNEPGGFVFLLTTTGNDMHNIQYNSVFVIDSNAYVNRFVNLNFYHKESLIQMYCMISLSDGCSLQKKKRIKRHIFNLAVCKPFECSKD